MATWRTIRWRAMAVLAIASVLVGACGGGQRETRRAEAEQRRAAQQAAAERKAAERSQCLSGMLDRQVEILKSKRMNYELTRGGETKRKTFKRVPKIPSSIKIDRFDGLMQSTSTGNSTVLAFVCDPKAHANTPVVCVQYDVSGRTGKFTLFRARHAGDKLISIMPAGTTFPPALFDEAKNCYG